MDHTQKQHLTRYAVELHEAGLLYLFLIVTHCEVTYMCPALALAECGFLLR